MATFTLAEAEADLETLLDLAETSEPVILTRDGKPVVQFVSVEPAMRNLTAEERAWLAARQSKSR